MTETDGLVDLHCHSSASGGATGTPQEVASYMARCGYAAFALTEHQSIRSLAAGRQAAAQEGLEYVTGIEMSCRVDDADAPDRVVDVLGFLFEPTEELERTAREALERSITWIRDGVARLRRSGRLDVTEEDLAAARRRCYGAGQMWKSVWSLGALGQVLEDRGLLDPDSSRSRNDQVRDLLSEVYPQRELPPRPEVGRVCEVLRRAGAVVTLAHPGGGGQRASQEQQRRLEWWLDRYVDGLEVYTRKHAENYEQLALEVVNRRGAPYSGGSDAHGYARPGAATDGSGVSKAPYRCLQSLKDFKAAHR